MKMPNKFHNYYAGMFLPLYRATPKSSKKAQKQYSAVKDFKTEFSETSTEDLKLIFEYQKDLYTKEENDVN